MKSLLSDLLEGKGSKGNSTFYLPSSRISLGPPSLVWSVKSLNCASRTLCLLSQTAGAQLLPGTGLRDPDTLHQKTLSGSTDPLG